MLPVQQFPLQNKYLQILCQSDYVFSLAMVLALRKLATKIDDISSP